MNGGVLALILAGLVGLGVGGYLLAADNNVVGVALFAMATIMFALAARSARSNHKDGSDAG